MMKTIEVMTMFEKYFTEEQRQALKERGDKLGPDAVKGVEEEWPRLIAAVREEMRKGTDPHSDTVRTLAKRWRELLDAFSGGNREMEASAAKMYREEPQVAQQYGLDAEVFEYIGEAMKS
jgi:hypothetical protein